MDQFAISGSTSRANTTRFSRATKNALCLLCRDAYLHPFRNVRQPSTLAPDILRYVLRRAFLVVNSDIPAAVLLTCMFGTHTRSQAVLLGCCVGLSNSRLLPSPSVFLAPLPHPFTSASLSTFIILDLQIHSSSNGHNYDHNHELGDNRNMDIKHYKVLPFHGSSRVANNRLYRPIGSTATPRSVGDPPFFDRHHLLYRSSGIRDRILATETDATSSSSLFHPGPLTTFTPVLHEENL